MAGVPLPIADAFATGVFPDVLCRFNVSSIVELFVKSDDRRAIRENSFELFTAGHVKDIKIKHDSIAEKVLVYATCSAQMKQRSYNVLIIIDQTASIIHANCGCPAGAGPRATCKHVAATCYSLEDFVKVFVLPEDVPSCTDKLQAWNKPRPTKLPGVPIFDINFERPRHNRQQRQNRCLEGRKPEAYRFDQTCEKDKDATVTFLQELKAWSQTYQKPLLMNTVTDPEIPIDTTYQPDPFNLYMTNFNSSLSQVQSLPLESRVQALKDVLPVSREQQELIQQNTLLQSQISDWFTLRRYRITGSIVGRVCNFYKYGRADPDNIANSIALAQPSSFKSAASQIGLDNESRIIDHYIEEKAKEGHLYTSRRLGLVIDKEYGFLAASPDAGIVENGNLVGLLECKTAVTKWGSKDIEECVCDSTYPLCVVTRNGEKYIELKKSHKWYHQIQLQLFVCRSFARFCDLAYQHYHSGSFHCQRFELDRKWVEVNLTKFDDFFSLFLAPKLLAIE